MQHEVKRVPFSITWREDTEEVNIPQVWATRYHYLGNKTVEPEHMKDILRLLCLPANLYEPDDVR